jgi:transcriptional regulator with XRE-family HTH domain
MDETELVLLAWVRDACTSGEALRIRIDSGLSQGEITEAVDVAVPTISRWENGERSPRGDAALRYARLLKRLRRAKAVSQ